MFIIKFFLIWNTMNAVIVMFMMLFCYRKVHRRVGNIVKQSTNMI